MKFSKPLNLVLTTILISIFSNSLLGQKLDPKERETQPDHIISSEIMGKDYKLYISFPSSYSANDTIRRSLLVLYYYLVINKAGASRYARAETYE